MSIGQTPLRSGYFRSSHPRDFIQSSTRSGQVVAQYRYQQEPLFAAGASTGVTAILERSPGVYLVLERSFHSQLGNKVRLFEYRPLQNKKRLLADIGTFGVSKVDNLEGMAWGPDGTAARVWRTVSRRRGLVAAAGLASVVFLVPDSEHSLREPPFHLLAILGVAIGLETFALRTAMGHARGPKGRKSWIRYIRTSRSPELPVLLLEDSAALLGLVLATLGIALALVTAARHPATASIQDTRRVLWPRVQRLRPAFAPSAQRSPPRTWRMSRRNGRARSRLNTASNALTRHQSVAGTTAGS